MKLLINGIQVPRGDFTGAKNTSVEISDIEPDGLKKAIVSQEYTIQGDTFELVKAELIDDPNGKNKSLPVKIYEDSCCETDILLFEGILRGDMVDWCWEDCQCTVTFLEMTEEVEKNNCIKSTLIDDNWNGFQQNNHPRLVYCNELRPDWLAYFILICAILLNQLLTALYPIVASLTALNAILGVIENAINLIPTVNVDITFNFDGNSSTNLLQEYSNLVDGINSRIIGCGRKHPSPLVRSYVNNVCNKCGLTFSSSILNDTASDYYNTLYLNAPVEKGTYDPNQTWIAANAPIKTLEGFLNDLKPVFNADFKVIGGTLYFERKDFFWSGDPFVSYEELDPEILIKERLCLSWRDEERPAFGKFTYIPDPVDMAGNEAMDRYSDKVEWNQPYSQLQSGFKDVTVSFGPSRFRGDGLDTDILGQFAFAPFSLGQQINAHQDVLILEKGTAFQPKLLIWDFQATFFARVKKYNIPGFNIPSNENYNFPYFFNEHNSVSNTAYPTNHPNSGLYPRFYSIDNPKLIIDKGQEFSFSMYYNCESLQGALTARYVQLPMGVGRISKITVNLDDKSLDIIGEV